MMIQSDELFSCAMNDRFVSRWSLVNKSLVCCYSAGSVAESLSVSKHVLACKLESGLIAYWSLDSDNITGSIDPTGSIELNCPGSDADVFLSCKAQKEDRILVAYGNVFSPTYEKTVS